MKWPIFSISMWNLKLCQSIQPTPALYQWILVSKIRLTKIYFFSQNQFAKDTYPQTAIFQFHQLLRSFIVIYELIYGIFLRHLLQCPPVNSIFFPKFYVFIYFFFSYLIFIMHSDPVIIERKVRMQKMYNRQMMKKKTKNIHKENQN